MTKKKPAAKGAGVRIRRMGRSALAANIKQPVRVLASCDPANPRDISRWTFRIDDGKRKPLDIPFAEVTDRELVLTLLSLLDRSGKILALAQEVAAHELRTDSKRKEGTTKSVTTNRNKADEKNAELLGAYEVMLKKNPQLNPRSAAPYLHDRFKTVLADAKSGATQVSLDAIVQRLYRGIRRKNIAR